ncbi:MAG TPA: MaoC/PaaZ C-terminal domain-containing protein [Steroidobacteraceae bacterium]|nr:MaoC/PaaZ C-terminal domain-containing protein [Steroidobacteraceae bacterium]
MSEPVSMNFASPPSPWLAYPKMLLSQRPALVPKGREVPLIEARIGALKAKRQHLADYRRVCGFAADGKLPLTFPHVMTTPLHMAILTHEAFPVRLLGLVHVRNEITAQRAVAEDEALDAHCLLRGHRDTDRGQEFDLLITLSSAAGIVWSETSTFLARQRTPRSGDGKPATKRAAADDTPAALQTTSWHADADIGRRYAIVSGDFNFIHLSDVTARLFGFERAIAHGMWSLARTAAELAPRIAADSYRLSVAFKLPIFLPSWVNLQSWQTRGGVGFALRDAQGEKPHMTGAIERL